MKGAAAAAANTLPIANGSGTTAFGKLTHTSLTTTGNSFGAQLLHVQDQKSSSTAGGSGTALTWVTRVLNTTLTNEISSASVASNQITLPAGTYWIEARAPAYNTIHKAKLRNVTSSADVLIGSSIAAPAGFGGSTDSIVRGRFTLAGTTVLELQHFVFSGSGSDQLGQATGAGVIEVYTDVCIWKIA